MTITSNSTPSKNSIYSSASSITVAHTVNAGTDRVMRIAVVMRDSAADRSVSSITWQGSATGITQVTGALRRGGTQKFGIDCWYLVAPATGSGNVVVTLDAAVNTFIAVHVDTIDGADQSTVYGTVYGASGGFTGTTGDASIAVTTAAGNDTLAIGGGFSSVTEPNGWVSSNTALQKSNHGGTLEYAATSHSQAANPTMAFTDSTAFGLQSVMIAVPFLAAGGGGDTTISCTPGNAAAAGATAVLLKTIPATAGNAVAAGITATIIAGNATLTTEPLKNNTGTLLASESGATVHVYNASTGVLVVTKTGQTTNGAGVMTITDALIVAGTLYRIVIVLSSTAEGMAKITAA